VDPLKYQREPRDARAAGAGELLTVKVRFKAPDGDTSRLLSRVLTNHPAPMTVNLGFASAVAEFGMLLRESPLRGSASFASLTSRARKFLGEDEDGYRAQFIQLAERAAMLRDREPASQSRR
jgi:Ca-activated chloride channel family protein